MKVKEIFFIVLPLAVAASSALMPDLSSQALHKDSKIIGLNLPFFEIADDGTSDKASVVVDAQNESTPISAKGEFAETRLLENLSTQPDATDEKITPEMFAMLFDSGAEVGLPVPVSKNPGKNKSKPHLESSVSSPDSSAPRFGTMPRPVIVGGVRSGSIPSIGSGAGNGGASPTGGSADPERPGEIVADPIEKELILDPNEDLSSENLDPLFGGPLNDPLIIVGLSSPPGGNTGNLDPSSPLNPLPPPGNAINPFAPPELTSPENRFSRPNPRTPRPFQFPRPGDRNVPIPTNSSAPAPVPEPATVILMGVGLFVLIFFKRRFRKS